MYIQLEMEKRELLELNTLAALYKEVGLVKQALRTIYHICQKVTQIHTMEQQLEQHLLRLQVPDLTAALAIDADDHIILQFDIYKINHRLIEWFNTHLSMSQRLLLEKYMNIAQGGVA